MIVFEHVTKQFAHIQAITDLSFKIKKGEVVGLLGANGAGKTTTMRALLGILSPDSGSIEVATYHPTTNRVAVTEVIGYLPENNPLWTDMLVSEYLTFIAKAKDAHPETEIRRVVQLADIKNVIHTKIENLSRGYRQRVGFAAALIKDPEVLVLDEPTSGLDPIEQEHIRDLIKAFQKKKTILISTHILSEVEASCSRVIILNKGELAYDGSIPRGRGALEKLFKKHVRS
jgi:ABC-2 type transport system ATP-binding protein